MPMLFLSPSTQEYNIYYDGSGSEEYYMNMIADAMEPYLRASGITFGRNNPYGTVGDSVRLSNADTYSLHLAIHSNASGSANFGKQTGSDVYFYPSSANGKRASGIAVKNLKEIYYEPSKVRALATTKLYEINNTRAPSILIEVAYHDNKTDAEWIKANIKKIAKNLSLTAAAYLGVTLIDPEPEKDAVVVTQGSRLNIREAPDISAKILGQAPNGASVTIKGQSGEWYFIRYRNIEGYSFGSYIKPKE